MVLSYRCTDCNQGFSSSNDFAQHRARGCITTTNGINRQSAFHGYGPSTSRRLSLRRPHLEDPSSINQRSLLTCWSCGDHFDDHMDLCRHLSAGDCDDDSDSPTSLRTIVIPRAMTVAGRNLSPPVSRPLPGGSSSQTSNRQCHSCRRTFHNETALSSHRGGAPNTSDNFACDALGCQFTSCSAAGLQSHRQSLRHFSSVRAAVAQHNPSALPRYDPLFTTCDQCSQRMWRHELERHISVRHPIFKCTDCNETFNSKNELETHQASGSSLREVVKIECPCGDTFPNRREAMRHIYDNREHPEHFGFCFHCELSFPTISDYLCHNEKLHDSLYPLNFLSEAATSKPGCSLTSSTALPRDTKAGKGKENNEDRVTLACIICLGFPEKLTATNCGHLYCNLCITSCLKVRSECPACRKRATLAELREIFV